MSRIIKFRAWVEETKYLRYDFDAIAWRSVRGYDFKEVHIVDFGYVDDDFTTAILMQYTGLRDKNGKEIWEGDIVTDGKHQSYHCLTGIHEVKFIDGAFFPFAVPGWEGTMEANTCEVIGNIYENPDLLQDPISSNER